MRNYEMIFIVRPDVADDEVQKLITQMEGVVTGAGGNVDKVEKMGRRRLAYRVSKQREGFYVLFYVQGTGDTVKEFERRLKVTDTVIKHLTVCTDEILQRAAKFKALRTKQEAKRRRSKPAPAPACAPRSRGDRTSIKELITMPVPREGAPSGERPPRREGPGGGGREAVFPPAQGLQILHRENRRDRLQGRAPGQ